MIVCSKFIDFSETSYRMVTIIKNLKVSVFNKKYLNFTDNIIFSEKQTFTKTLEW